MRSPGHQESAGPTSQPGAVAGPVIQVAQGRVTGYRGIRFGGIASVPATRDDPTMIRVAVRHAAGELCADLGEGDVLQIPGHTWQLGHIHFSGHLNGQSWRASLTRIG